MPLSSAVAGRLWNWKFSQAAYHMNNELNGPSNDGTPPAYTDDEKSLITTLAEMYGDVGFAIDGHAAGIIRAAVAWVLQQPLDAPEDWLPPVMRNTSDVQGTNRV